MRRWWTERAARVPHRPFTGREVGRDRKGSVPGFGREVAGHAGRVDDERGDGLDPTSESGQHRPVRRRMPAMTQDSDRIDGLEMRFAEQDRVIEDLDATVTAQWAAIEALQRRLAQFTDRLADAERRLPGEAERPPPHY